MEADHNVFVLHQIFGHIYDFVGCFVTRLSVERTQDNASDGVVLHDRVLMSHDAALSELCVQIVRSPRSLVA